MNNIMNISEVNNSLNNLNYYINAINDNLNEISTLIEKFSLCYTSIKSENILYFQNQFRAKSKQIVNNYDINRRFIVKNAENYQLLSHINENNFKGV